MATLLTRQSGIVGCACCGLPVMVNDVSREKYCDGCPGPRSQNHGKCDPRKSWHCATGECDGTLCDDGTHES